MSLLMDALRRAEAEKRAAAAREAPTLEETLPEHFDLRLEPEPERANARASSPRAPRGHELERVLDMGSDDPTLADEFMLDSRVAPPAPDQATLGRPERVTPQTVFAAGRQPPMSRQTLVLATAALLGVASLGVLSWRMLGEPPPAAPMVSLAPEVPESPPRLEGSATPEAAQVPAASDRPSPALPEDRTEPDTRPEGANAPIRTAGDAPVAMPAPEAAAQDRTPENGAIEPAAIALSSPERRPARTPPIFAPRAEDPPVPAPAATEATEAIVISRAPSGATQMDTRLEAAYSAWRNGDLASARAGYESVLATAPRSVDAHLGLGAIALRENQPVAARSHYARALELAPGNAVATAALFLIDAGEGDAEAADRLARLPDAADPYVQFALGNHHARHNRWAEAQAAYFAASKGEPDNADYAFNLAVSLDRLGQRAAARAWYVRALALYRPVHRFDPAIARARLATLDTP